MGHVICYNASDETGALELGDRRESEDCLHEPLVGMISEFPGSTFNGFSILNQSCTSDTNTIVS